MIISSDIRFAIVPEWLIYYPDITPIALRTFVVMARLSDKDTDQLVRGRPDLAERVRCSPKTLDRALSLLRRAGAVTWENRRDERGLAPSNFTLHYTPPVTPPMDTSDQRGMDTSDQAFPKGEEREREDQQEDPPPTPPTPPVTGTAEMVPALAGPCPRALCDRGAGHPGPHRDAWFDAIGEALYPGEPVPEHQASRVAKLARRAERAGHPPERIGWAAAWILRNWGPAKLTLGSLSEHYERASGLLAQLTDDDRDTYLVSLRDQQRRARLALLAGQGNVLPLTARKGTP